jgi:hypothetical protein
MIRKPFKESDRKPLIAKAKAIIGRSNSRWLPQSEFCRLAGIKRHQITRCFDGYSDLLQAAGLPARGPNGRILDDDMMQAMADLFRQEKGVVTYLRFRRLSRYSAAAYLRRWGSWRAAVRAFCDWQKQHDPEFPHADQLPSATDGPATPVWKTHGGRRYGETLNFRGLLHAPVNEQGVVFLFATLAADLGYLIDSLGSEFPDCEAKRRVGKAWEKVRIEFEYESRNFQVHAHDPEECDLIVCWDHNWPECPIEVLELKTLVAPQPRSVAGSEGLAYKPLIGTGRLPVVTDGRPSKLCS